MASSAPIPAPRGLVVCSAHNAQRKGEFCEMKPVMNADMEVIDYVCVCKPAFRCKSAAERNGNAGHDEATGTASPPPPVIMDASSTSVSAHRTHPHATSASAAAAGGAGEADVSTLFAVSFYETSRPAAGASSPQQGADASAAAAAAAAAAVPKDGHSGSVAAATAAAAAVAISDSDDAPESEADSLESVPHIAPAAAAVPGPSAAPTTPRGRPRYYDVAQGQGGERGGGGGGAGAGGGHASPVKVCWSCGMPGHEKPSCPNILCRTCHQKRGPYGTPHRCGFVQTPSPFLVNPTAAEWRAATAGTDMSAVRCVACNGLGHLDCSVVVAPSSYALVALSSSSASSNGIGEAAVPQTVVATCCFCGVRGHTVHDCRQRERVNPDNFERRQQVAASDTAHRGTSSGSGMGSYQGSYNNSYGYSSQQQQPPYQPYPPQQQQQRSYGGSSSAPYARYGNDRDRDRGGQRREREWDDNSNHNYRDRRDQRGGGYVETHSRREGGERHEHQRRRFDSGPSSPAPASSYSRDRYPSAGGGGGRAAHQQWEQQGGASSASRSHDHSSPHPHYHHSRRDQHSSTGSSHQQQPRSNTGWKGRGGRRGNSGYDSGDDLF